MIYICNLNSHMWHGISALISDQRNRSIAINNSCGVLTLYHRLCLSTKNPDSGGKASRNTRTTLAEAKKWHVIRNNDGVCACDHVATGTIDPKTFKETCQTSVIGSNCCTRWSNIRVEEFSQNGKANAYNSESWFTLEEL